jgi:hypothetical protein
VESIGRVDRGVWLIDSGVPYHITPHMEWFYEYEKYDGGDVFPGDDLTTKIMGCRRVNLLLKYGRIRTLPRVMHDPKIARRLIYLRKLDTQINSNVLGPMFVPSLGKFVYYVSFINDFLRNTWIYFLIK